MDLFGIGGWQIILILLVAMMVFGPGRMVEIARTLGRIAFRLKNITSDLAAQVSREIEEQKRDKPAQRNEEDKP